VCGSPAPSWYPPPPPAPNPTQQAPPSCGWNCAVGVGIVATAAFCAENPEICAAPFEEPPPPPPPPQNCYAAGTCVPPKASDAFTDQTHITESKPTDTENPEHVPGDRVIDEKTPTVKGNPEGLTPSAGNTTGSEASAQNGYGSGEGLPSTSGPVTPEPSGSGEGGGPSGAGSTPGGAGSTPSTTPADPTTTDTSSSSLSGNGGDDEGLTRAEKIAVNALIGSAGSLINDYYHNVRGLHRVLLDAIIGGGLGSLGGLNDTFTGALVSAGAIGFDNSVYSQGHGGPLSLSQYAQALADTGLSVVTGGLAYGAGPVAEHFLQPLDQSFNDATGLGVSLVGSLLTNTCDPDNVITNGSAC
jgi:hypothetical protein